MLRRSLFIILFISSALTVGLIPNASSQQFTTSTSILTSSLTQTTTSYFESYYSITSGGMGTRTTTLQFSSANSCYYQGWGIFNSTGTIHVEYSATGPMTLYILGDGLWGLWAFAVGGTLGSSLVGGPCDTNTLANFDVVYQKDISAAGSFDVNLPSSQNPYGFVIIAPLSETGPTITLAYNPVFVVYATTETVSIPVTSTATSATTLTFITTLELPFMQTYGSWIAAVIVGALVVAVLFFALRRTRTHRPKQATLSQFAMAPSSCIKCGAELPPTSEFCNKCGTKQS